MANRTETPMNEILDAVVAKLKTISAKKNSSFLTSPASVTRLTIAGDFAGKQKPYLGVSVVGWTAEPQTGRRFNGTLSIAVHCATENTASAEGELLRLVSDVVFALASDVTLANEVVYLFPQSFEPNVDLINRTGLAVTTVIFECVYKFDSTAP